MFCFGIVTVSIGSQHAFLILNNFIWQVYSASPIFGVEFETEEKVSVEHF